MSDSITERTPLVVAAEGGQRDASAWGMAKFYENLDKIFKELDYEMTKFATIDPDVHAGVV